MKIFRKSINVISDTLSHLILSEEKRVCRKAGEACARLVFVVGSIVVFSLSSMEAFANSSDCQSPEWLAESAISIPFDGAPGMRVKVLNDQEPKTFILTFSRGDEVISGLKKFSRDQNVQSGTISAVGAFECTVTGWYDSSRKKLKTLILRGDREVTSFSGNFATLNSQPITHIHLSSSDSNGQLVGGHLVRGWVGPGLEVMVTTTRLPLHRVYDEDADAFVPKLDGW